MTIYNTLNGIFETCETTSLNREVFTQRNEKKQRKILPRYTAALIFSSTIVGVKKKVKKKGKWVKYLCRIFLSKWLIDELQYACCLQVVSGIIF